MTGAVYGALGPRWPRTVTQRGAGMPRCPTQPWDGRAASIVRKQGTDPDATETQQWCGAHLALLWWAPLEPPCTPADSRPEAC
ncbi:hypothetical protein NDU88_004302 [Pleurodeles waltl]|uniref:Uncharacterized protein n=1 Tax=Pleurodeles waltl TaxID=8319 RepID=A0AAV7MUS2_PLEWA|nr:hypothetical protein NDU88_004302 [Pleurodeles waltl]